jgi:hypothetical protein
MDVNPILPVRFQEIVAIPDATRREGFAVAANQTLEGQVVSVERDTVIVSIGRHRVPAQAAPGTTLQAGEAVRLFVRQVDPDQVVMQIVARGASLQTMRSLTDADLSAELTGLGITPDESTLAVARALINRGLPVTAANILEVRGALTRLGTADPGDLDAAVFLKGQGLPMTGDGIQIVRQALQSRAALGAQVEGLRSALADLAARLAGLGVTPAPRAPPTATAGPVVPGPTAEPDAQAPGTTAAGTPNTGTTAAAPGAAAPAPAGQPVPGRPGGPGGAPAATTAGPGAPAADAEASPSGPPAAGPPAAGPAAPTPADTATAPPATAPGTSPPAAPPTGPAPGATGPGGPAAGAPAPPANAADATDAGAASQPATATGAAPPPAPSRAQSAPAGAGAAPGSPLPLAEGQREGPEEGGGLAPPVAADEALARPSATLSQGERAQSDGPPGGVGVRQAGPPADQAAMPVEPSPLAPSGPEAAEPNANAAPGRAVAPGAAPAPEPSLPRLLSAVIETLERLPLFDEAALADGATGLADGIRRVVADQATPVEAKLARVLEGLVSRTEVDDLVAGDLKTTLHQLVREVQAHLDPRVADRLPPEAMRDLQSAASQAEALLGQVELQQLANAAPRSDGQPPSYLVLQLPLPGGRESQSAQIRIRQESDGRTARIDPKNVHLVFQLELQHLQTVRVGIRVVDRHMSCQLGSSDPAVTDLLARHADELRSGLTGLGYAVEPVKTALLRVEDLAPPPGAADEPIAPPPRATMRIDARA